MRGAAIRRYVAVLGASALLASTTAVLLSERPASSAGREPAVAGIVERIASASAASEGDAVPTSIEWVVTTRRAANRGAAELSAALGAEEVYFVAMTGHFVLRTAATPGRDPAPTGTVETLTIATGSGAVRDLGIVNVEPDLAAFGRVTRVERPITAVASIASVAAASNPCRPTHCYSTAELIVNPPEGFSGIYGTLRSQCLDVPKPKGHFIDNEMWIVSGPYWVEVGMTVGVASAGGFSPNPIYFWADDRPRQGGYHEHYGSGATLQQSHAFSIKYHGAGPTWAIAGPITGRSVHSIPNPADFLEGGVESTSPKNHTNGSFSKAGYWDTGGALHPGWTTADVVPTVRVGHGMQFQWTHQYDAWRDSQNGGC